MTVHHEPVLLFCYGTLLLPEVQVQVFGRTVETKPDRLPGYAFGPIAITDPEVLAISGSDRHRAAYQKARAHIEGSVLLLTEAELALADAYEVDSYCRMTVLLSSGREAFAYVLVGTGRLDECA